MDQTPNMYWTFSLAGNTVTLYRVGDHVDISRGPMMGNTSFVGRLPGGACENFFFVSLSRHSRCTSFRES